MAINLSQEIAEDIAAFAPTFRDTIRTETNKTLASQTASLSPLTAPTVSDKIPSVAFDVKAYGKMMIQTLQTQLNYWRNLLGIYQKCPHCQCEVK